MPHQTLDLPAIARVLNLSQAEVERLVKDREIPFQRRGDRILFQPGEIAEWASQRILSFDKRRLAEYQRQAAAPADPSQPPGESLAAMVPAGAIAPAMTAKTRASALRDLAALADETGLLNDRAALIAGLEEREVLCSTAVPGGLAFPHPRQRQPYLLETSFIVVGRALQPIHFGAPDGEPTDLFFLLCLDDERLHLRTLARFALLAHKTNFAAQLRAAPDVDALREALVAAEEELFAQSRSGRGAAEH